MDLKRAALDEHAPAKINLALHVVGQRADGYHLIESLSVFTSFGDAVRVQPGETDEFRVSGPFAHQVPTGGDNLVVKARDAFRRAFPEHAGTPASIALKKNIPATSGVGGGSGDAAATLRALAQLFRIPADHPAFDAMALGLGADVPMCLEGRPLIARGIGEVIEPAVAFPVLHLVLLNPGIAVSTPTVFAALREKRNAPLPSLAAGMAVDELVTWLAATRNDLFPPAVTLAPTVVDALAVLMAQGARLARMSGSGATCFGLFADAGSAKAAAAAIGAARPGWFVTATRTMA